MRKPHLVGALALLFLASCTQKEKYDLIIEKGQVIDGTGARAFKADVGIREGRIVLIGDLSNGDSPVRIDATGLTVAPGFIDLHAHIEPIMRLPDAESHVRQGVTTALGGPDGSAPWPFGKYLDSLSANFKLGMNVAYLTGHNTIRRKVMGNADRKPTPAELDSMKAMVARAMSEGAFGLSTGLKYLPGTFAETAEVIELSRMAARNGGIYTSHLREEGLGLLAGVREAILIGREAQIAIVLTHHKAMGKPMWGASKITTAMVDSARGAGLDIMMDQYPYTASSTGLSVLIPSWALEGTPDDFKKRVADKKQKTRILEAIKFNLLNDRGGGDLKNIQFSNVSWDSTLQGKTLLDYVVQLGKEVNLDNGADAVLEMQLKGSAGCIFHAISEEDVVRIMQHPFTMHASDGSLSKFGEDHPHPRAYGTFPRILGRYVREQKVLTLEDAIRKMTSLPADRMKLHDRGRIKEGLVADITIFNPATVTDMATFEKPHQYPKGIEYVIVGGIVTVDPKGMTPDRAGVVLRGTQYLR
jgi:dihydroorotase/N-acyl-D-amino-acid deacylase